MKTVSIGCGSGFWGDTPEGARQMIFNGEVDYLVLDYLAEVTMSILARAKLKNPESGYVPDFVSLVIKPYAKEIARRGIKVVVNAGGVNPESCAREITAELDAQGIKLNVAAVIGDNLLDNPELLGSDITEMFTGKPIPEKLISANAYLGAFPIAAALDAGADIVVTGRCVDSALALGPLIHEFKWDSDDWTALSAGSLAGHVLECGPQVTGGFQTDWEENHETWDRIGFPIVICHDDGSFLVTKPQHTGGSVTVRGVSEQITYETGDPGAYILPDVVCDWRNVQVQQVGEDLVRVNGALGRPSTDSYKVSATHMDGYRCMATLLVRGADAVSKSKALANSILSRTRSIFSREGYSDYKEVSIECLGSEEAFGTPARNLQSREIVLKIGVRHTEPLALDIFAREIYPTSTATVQGVAGVFWGRPKIQPVVRLFSFLKNKTDFSPAVVFRGEKLKVAVAEAVGAVRTELAEQSTTTVYASSGPVDIERSITVPLISLAYARSGDKGDASNIAVLSRQKEFLPLLAKQLTEERVKEYLSHLVEGTVTRYDWPGLDGFNFLMTNALGGGGAGSLRYDPQGKAHAQILLEFPIHVPESWVQKGRVSTQ